jgi:uncharacterized membrane protein YvbJ
MTRFCSNCGSQIPDNAAFCQSCGTPTAQSEAPQQQPYANPQNPQQSYDYTNFTPQAAPQAVPQYAGVGYPAKKKTSKGLIAGIAVAALAIIVIIIVLVSTGGGYKGAVDKYFDSISAGNVKKLISCFPPSFRDDLEYYMDDDFETYIEVIDNVKYKITDKESMSKREIRDLKDDYDDYDLDISEGYTLEVDITVKFDYSALDDEDYFYYDDDDDEMEETIELYVIKIKGKWYLIDDSMM